MRNTKTNELKLEGAADKTSLCVSTKERLTVQLLMVQSRMVGGGSGLWPLGRAMSSLQAGERGEAQPWRSVVFDARDLQSMKMRALLLEEEPLPSLGKSYCFAGCDLPQGSTPQDWHSAAVLTSPRLQAGEEQVVAPTLKIPSRSIHC